MSTTLQETALGLAGAAGEASVEPAQSAQPLARTPSPLSQFLATYKGSISLGFSVLVFGASYYLPAGPAFWVRAAGEAALIGSLVDFMAIQMLFRKIPLLPGSGVIPRNRLPIIDGLAHAVENEWLTPETLKRHFAGLDLVGLLNAGVSRIKDDEELLTYLLQQVSEQGVSWIDNKKFLEFLSTKLKERLGKLGTLAHNMGVMDRDELAAQVAESIAHEIKRLPENPEVKGIIQRELSRIGEQTGSSEALKQKLENLKVTIIDTIFARIEGRIGQMVRENLGLFTDEEIREMFETKTRSHLEWIRVNGAVYGGIFGLILAAIHRYFEAAH